MVQSESIELNNIARKYYSMTELLSKNTPLSLVLSDRSDGKTFDCKVKALEDFNNGYVSIYMRRYKTEISQSMKMTFFDELKDKEKYKHLVPEGEYIITKESVSIKKDGKIKPIVYIIPLTMSIKLKSNIDVTKVRHIFYDEFVPMDHKYLKDEVNLILDYYKTIDRDRDIVQMICLGNRVDPFNPLFDYFGLSLSICKNKIKTYKNNSIAVEIYSDQGHRELNKITRFGKLVQETPYDNYNNGGILNDYNIKIENIENAKYMFSFLTRKGEGSIWLKSQKLILSEKKRKDGYVIVDKIYNTDREEILCIDIKIKEFIRSYYRINRLYAESEKAFYKFEDILVRTGR